MTELLVNQILAMTASEVGIWMRETPARWRRLTEVCGVQQIAGGAECGACPCI
jgi:hypothetical protein